MRRGVNEFNHQYSGVVSVMRDYGKVSPKFWVGKTGKALRGDMPAQVLALYLMTSPHANMIGIYYCPVEYMAKETGLPIEGASKALQRLIDADFCTYEVDEELVFVHAFAEHQIGDSLKPTDMRVKGVLNELEKVPKGQCWRGFMDRYAAQYHLQIPGDKDQNKKPPRSPLEDPSKPEAEAEAEAEDISTADKSADRPTAKPESPGFSEFWATWPTNDRKQAKGKCLESWKKASAERDAALILAHVSSLKNGAWLKDNGQFVPTPLVYLNQRRWEGAEASAPTSAGGLLPGAI
jgi:hypothetical protein